jgi:hypothetical protein
MCVRVPATDALVKTAVGDCPAPSASVSRRDKPKSRTLTVASGDRAAVNHAVAMRMIERGRDVPAPLDHFPNGRTPLLQNVGKCRPFDQFEDDEWQRRVVLGLVDAADVRVIENRRVLRLDEQSRAGLPVFRIGHELEGDRSTEATVAGAIDLADAARPKELEDREATNDGARRKPGDEGRARRPRQHRRGRLLDERASLLVADEECRHLLQQLPIAAAGGFEKSRPVGRRELQCGVEQVPRTGPTHRISAAENAGGAVPDRHRPGASIRGTGKLNKA